MPVLGALFATLFGGFATFLAGFITKKVLVAGTAVAALAASMGALLLLFRTQVAPLIEQAFSTNYGQVIGLAFPPIAGNCLAVIAAVWAGCVLYRWQVTAIKISASAS